MEAKRPKAMVKSGTVGVELARMMRPRFNQNLRVEHMDKASGRFTLVMDVLLTCQSQLIS